ncbi:hypothetical protein CRG98_010265 [Punica granatum]|uniref:C3H1-type domain-containing protein n=1 Tax=Punica granatum TaxID=22663 RepID=A0A2I0KLE6_PUNGR|nr:hypothetical protein CRG98_010265 [Punica granatum]
MEVRAARTMPADQRRYRRVGTGSKVCSYWLAGRCTKNACRFLHGELPLQQNAYHGEVKPSSLFKGGGPSKILKGKDGLKRKERLCRHWASGNCVKGDKCLYQHSWSCGHSFGLLAKLEGHKKGIAGIGFPSGSDKLSTGSKDETVKIWDCHTGQCSDTVSVGSEVGSLISEGPWVFVGLQSAVKAWNLECCTAFDLKASSGLVYSMAVGSDLLFAGCQNGDILVWRGSSPTNPLLLVATLKGHTHAVLSLVVGANRLYSASMDRTIRGVLALKGMHDMEGKPMLLTACDDDTVHLYELPTIIFARAILGLLEISLRLLFNRSAEPSNYLRSANWKISCTFHHGGRLSSFSLGPPTFCEVAPGWISLSMITHLIEQGLARDRARELGKSIYSLVAGKETITNIMSGGSSHSSPSDCAGKTSLFSTSVPSPPPFSLPEIDIIMASIAFVDYMESLKRSSLFRNFLQEKLQHDAVKLISNSDNVAFMSP